MNDGNVVKRIIVLAVIGDILERNLEIWKFLIGNSWDRIGQKLIQTNGRGRYIINVIIN